MILSNGLFVWLVIFTVAAIVIATRVTTAAAKQITYLQHPPPPPPGPPVWMQGPDGQGVLVQQPVPPQVMSEFDREVPILRFASTWAMTFGVVWVILVIVVFFLSQVSTY